MRGRWRTKHTASIAAGYPRGLLIAVYVLRNSLVVTLAQIGLLFGALLAGGVVVESIFDWPGIGRYGSEVGWTPSWMASRSRTGTWWSGTEPRTRL